jgi:4-hydroxy-tetrahydrodipicolinate synthase
VKGIWAAALTPVNERFEPDAPRAIAYWHELLGRGCDGIAALGTTGEAMSFGVDLRVAFTEALAASKLPMDRMIVGTGASSLADAARLTRCAFDCGFSSALVMPPFFFRDASDDGVIAFFDALLSKVRVPPRGVLLYNFPRMSGITFDLELTSRLIAAFGDRIAGVKDSSNDARLQAEILARHPSLDVFPGSESDLDAALAAGAAGCISGSVALWPRLAREVFAGRAHERAEELSRRRAALAGHPLVPAMRYLTARLRSDPQWQRAMPPQAPLTDVQRRGLERTVEPLAEA